MVEREDIFIPISILLKTFKEFPYYFLTEEDVRGFLVHQFYQRQNLKSLKLTIDDKQTIAIHSEVRWYKYSDDQNKRTDIVMIDPEDLVVTNLYEEMPGKCFGFNKFWAAIELKMRRHSRYKCNAELLKEVREDLELLRLVRNNSSQLDISPIFCAICLDRGGSVKLQMDNLRRQYQSDGIGLIYVNEK
jgi:hypothetical protein